MTPPRERGIRNREIYSMPTSYVGFFIISSAAAAQSDLAITSESAGWGGGMGHLRVDSFFEDLLIGFEGNPHNRVSL
jgi:hypothetical protein